MTKYDQEFCIDGESFKQMRKDVNKVLNKLLKNMIDKATNEGSVTIKIDITLNQEFMPIPPELRTEKSGETRRVLKPSFKHKIGSTMQIKDDASGEYTTDMMELAFDDETGGYILTPVKDGQQMSIYDYMDDEKDDAEDETEEESTDSPEETEEDELPRSARLLPGPEDEMNPPEPDEEEVIEADYKEVEEKTADDLMDMIGDDSDPVFDDDISEYEDYEYQEPWNNDDDLVDDEEERGWD